MTNQPQTSQMVGSEESVGLVEDDLRDLEVTALEVQELEAHGVEDYRHDRRVDERVIYEYGHESFVAFRRYRRAVRVGALTGLLVGGLGAAIGYRSLGGAGATIETATAVNVSLGAAAAVLLATFMLSWLLSWLLHPAHTPREQLVEIVGHTPLDAEASAFDARRTTARSR